MAGCSTHVMTGSAKPSGGKTTRQVSREPERSRSPGGKELCSVTSDILSARCVRRGEGRGGDCEGFGVLGAERSAVWGVPV